MSQNMTLTFDPDGTGHCLYSELIDLRALGPIKCRRASHIEYCVKKQVWQVLSPDRKQVLFSHPFRSTCLEWEQQNLTEKF